MSDEVKIPLPQSLQEIVGALLFASETPLTATELREAVRAVEAEAGENKEVMDVYRTCTSKEIAEALRGLEKALEVAGSGFQLVCTGGAYRLQSVPSCGRYVRALLKMDRPNRLGRASLETLAIVAYRQPLTKSEIEAIRGVDVSGNIKTLMDLQLVRLVGKSELPGHPFLYGTTPLFLEHFGLASLQQLNELDPTLQRSNPKQKAASYKKPESAKPVEAKEAEAPTAASEEAATPEAPASEEAAVEEIASTEAGDAGVVEIASSAEADGTGAAEAAASDDNFFIDDTPDEFDDDDDEDDESDDNDESDEDEEGEEADDEGDAADDDADGADEPDGV